LGDDLRVGDKWDDDGETCEWVNAQEERDTQGSERLYGTVGIDSDVPRGKLRGCDSMSREPVAGGKLVETARDLSDAEERTAVESCKDGWNKLVREYSEAALRTRQRRRRWRTLLVDFWSLLRRWADPFSEKRHGSCGKNGL
jgi:hypothetical protein